MTFSYKPAALSALLLLGAATPVLADPFTLNPNAAKLNGTKFTADTFVLSDYAQITFTPTGYTPAGNLSATFLDNGYLPVIGFRLGGQAVAPPGYLAPNGSGWGAYIQYTGTGTQILSPQGVPLSATYATLSYSIVGYNGLATFGLDPQTGAAVVGGAISGVTTLDTGSLIGGSLAFDFSRPVPKGSPPGPTIVGQVTATLDEVRPQFIESNPGGLAVTFIHPPGEYIYIPTAPLEITGGTSSSATILSRKGTSAPATVDATVPEPMSAALLGTVLAGGWLLTRRRAAG